MGQDGDLIGRVPGIISEMVSWSGGCPPMSRLMVRRGGKFVSYSDGAGTEPPRGWPPLAWEHDPFPMPAGPDSESVAQWFECLLHPIGLLAVGARASQTLGDLDYGGPVRNADLLVDMLRQDGSVGRTVHIPHRTRWPARLAMPILRRLRDELLMSRRSTADTGRSEAVEEVASSDGRLFVDPPCVPAPVVAANLPPDGIVDPYGFRWGGREYQFTKNERRYFRFLKAIWPSITKRAIYINEVNDNLAPAGECEVLSPKTIAEYARKLTAILRNQCSFPLAIKKDGDVLRLA